MKKKQTKKNLLPRPVRKRRRASEERGLPPDQQLIDLAKSYLEQQSQHWPELAEAGILKPPTDATLKEMVRDYKQRHGSDNLPTDAAGPLADRNQPLAGGYCRYSCDNSQPTSIVDQLTNILRVAKEHGRFIPWQFLLADYAVSGLDAKRHGYSAYKTLFRQTDCQLAAVYIDDFTRASRDEKEWWNLYSIAQQFQIPLIGASDGFNSADPNSDVLLTMFGLVSRLFVKGLREKVSRGMRGAVERGTVVGKLPLGFTREQELNVSGEVVINSKGKPVHRIAVDEETREWVEFVFDAYVNRGQTPGAIAKHFNQHEVDTSTGWTRTSILKVLRNEAYLGRFIWNRYRKEVDPETGKKVKIENAEEEWAIFEDPELAIIPEATWEAAQAKLEEMRASSPRTGQPWRVCNHIANTLFGQSLVCGYCGRSLSLFRSTERYKSMYCRTGKDHAHNCKLDSSKSVRVIEECLLGYLRDNLFTEETIRDLVRLANEELENQRRRAPREVKPLRKQHRQLQQRVDRLFDLLEREPEREIAAEYEQRIGVHKREQRQLAAQIAELKRENEPVPAALEEEAVLGYLADLRSLLQQNIPEAAERLRELFGPISITHKRVSGRLGARWTATFSPQLAEVLRHFAGKKSCPSALPLEYLSRRKWTHLAGVRVELRKLYRYELLRADFRRMHRAEFSMQQMADRFDMHQATARHMLHYAFTGHRPDWGNKKAG